MLNIWCLSRLVFLLHCVIVLTSSVVSVCQPSDRKPESVVEVSEMEGDTLDPQTGLFYRSSPSAADPVKQTNLSAASQPALCQTESSASIQPPPPPPQLHSKPQLSQPSSSSTPPLTKKLPKLREQSQPKVQTLTPSPRDRPVMVPAQTGTKVSSPGTPTKPLLTPQLPKLQQAPTSLHRPLHTAMSHPPPLQAHHPVSTDKTASSQVSVTPDTVMLVLSAEGNPLCFQRRVETHLQVIYWIIKYPRLSSGILVLLRNSCLNLIPWASSHHFVFRQLMGPVYVKLWGFSTSC